MNLRVKSEAIRDGMYLADPVYLSNGTMAIPVGTRLEDRHKKFLLKMGIKEVEVSFAPTSSGEGMMGIKSEVPVAKSVEDGVYQLLKEELKILLSVPQMNYSNYLEKNSITHNTINNLYIHICTKKHLLECLLDVKSVDSFTFKHSINVMVLSVLIGSAMGINDKNLHNLGIGALFHDIGKMKVPREILFNEGKLTEQDKETMARHTVNGYEIMIRMPDMAVEAANIALMHHERLDGSGYPYGVKQEEIHLYSRIVGIADVYEAMTAERNYRRAHNPNEIIEYLMANAGTLFDEKVVKALLGSVTIYRIGSVVQLSNNECGVVVQTNPNLPARPVLRIVFDRHFLKVRKDAIIDLASPEHTTLSIIRVFG